MPDEQTSAHALDAECKMYSNYLLRCDPTPYILAKYREAHQASPKLAHAKPQPFDRFMVALSHQNSLTTKLVDAYAAFFYRNALVRKKMVLLLAILESTAPTYAVFDQIDKGGARVFLFRLALQGIVFALTLVLAMVVMSPLHLGFELRALFVQLTGRLATQLETIGSAIPGERSTSSAANVSDGTSELPFLH